MSITIKGPLVNKVYYSKRKLDKKLFNLKAKTIQQSIHMLKHKMNCTYLQKHCRFLLKKRIRYYRQKRTQNLPSLQLHRVDNQRLYELIWRSEDQISIYTKFFLPGITLQMDLQKANIFSHQQIIKDAHIYLFHVQYPTSVYSKENNYSSIIALKIIISQK